MNQLTINRPAFVDAHPHLKADHLEAQRAMFGAARTFGLEIKDRAAMIGGINELFTLGLRSRREMTVREMQAFAVAIEAGAFEVDSDWRLTGDVVAELDGEGNIDLLAGDGQAPRILCRVCRERAQYYALCDENGDSVRGPGFCRECAPRPRVETISPRETRQFDDYVLSLLLEVENLEGILEEVNRLAARYGLALEEARAELLAQLESLQRNIDSI